MITVYASIPVVAPFKRHWRAEGILDTCSNPQREAMEGIRDRPWKASCAGETLPDTRR